MLTPRQKSTCWVPPFHPKHAKPACMASLRCREPVGIKIIRFVRINSSGGGPKWRVKFWSSKIVIFCEFIFHFWLQKGGIYHTYIFILLLIARWKPNRHVRTVYLVWGCKLSQNYFRFEKTLRFWNSRLFFSLHSWRVFTNWTPWAKSRDSRRKS